MTWFKVDDKFHDHPKVQLLFELYEADAVTAIGLWGIAGTWCGDQKSDGLISGRVLSRWCPDWKTYAAMLIEVGLWHEVDVGGRPHVQFHDYTDVCICPGRDEPVKGRGWNPSKKKTEADAAYERRKNELSKDYKLKAAIHERDQERCRYCGAGVQWSDKRSSIGGTYDHVDPEGPNNLANVVTACRGCNGSKGRRTPEEWGYGLLKPGSMGPARRLHVVPDPESTPESTPHQESGRGAAGRVGSGTGLGSGRVGSGASPESTPAPSPAQGEVEAS